MPDIRQGSLRISRHKGFGGSIFGKDRSPDRSDICTVNVNADGCLIVQGIRHAMNVANPWADRIHVARIQHLGWAFGGKAGAGAPEAFHALGTPQNPNKSPNTMVVDRGSLARAPYETHYGEAFATVAMKKILLISVGIRTCISLRQPVIGPDQ